MGAEEFDRNNKTRLKLVVTQQRHNNNHNTTVVGLGCTVQKPGGMHQDCSTSLTAMEGYGSLGFSDVNSAVRKKRSNTFRRPRNDSQVPLDYRDISSLSSTPPSDDSSKGSSDDNNDFGSVSQRKEINLNQCGSRASFSNLAESESAKNVIKNEDGGFADSDEASNDGSFRGSNEQRNSGVDSRRSSKGVLAPANWKSTSKVGHSEVASDGLDNENKVKKVKLKVGGVTRTIQAKTISDGASAVGSSTTKSSHISGSPRPRQKLIQDNSDDNRSFTSDKGTGLQGQGATLKDASRNSYAGNADPLSDRMPDENIYVNKMEKDEPLRKSKRVPKRRLLVDTFDDEDDDDVEIRYLEKLKTSKVSTGCGVEDKDDKERESRTQRKISWLSKRNADAKYAVDMGDYGSSRSVKETKKSRSGRVYGDTDYVEEEEPISDCELDSKRKRPRKEFVESLIDPKKERTVTTRQRALQTGKDVSSSVSLIEFPNGLPPAAPRKQKEKLSEVEQQLKKAEAAQRRKMQVEKAARESEAEAIRKILGQDSSRKKREDKIKKRQENLAQEKAANAEIVASDSVRWVMGPSGTVVTFPDEIGLPTIFDSKPCSYPPPREKCAGPSCSNPYKYRDSQSKLPLCSLQCYKAIHKKMPPLSAC
ncbi:hypothetical protein FEM48_Zijuj02G0130100 [Ziziphus jujuba var. spinosa]|uniref:INO80 complex subunit B-like conserved region domain-containing protein n=1 Tax=Ziziphus jujuba var. spinosa TaxID=714518 RepID=A0A978VVV8_ZIZJJ|nr:hypothetical protein FEM48_Zijuj02G0130100 [Ziziphus jujuba var. spinosa]